MLGRSIRTPLVGISINKEFFEEDQMYAWVITPYISSMDEIYNNFINVFISVLALVIRKLTKKYILHGCLI